MSGKRASSRSLTHDSPVFWRRFLLDRAKLKATSRTSALLSGFAMVAMVEMQLSSEPKEDEKVSYVIFALITTLLIATHMFSLLISTCILPSLEVATAGSSGVPRELRSSLSPASTPYQSMKPYIEVAWVCSTGLGILLFFVEVGILSWVKFFNTAHGKIISPSLVLIPLFYHLCSVAAYASIGLVIPLFFIFTLFAFKFYRQLVADKLEEEDVQISQLLRLRDKIEESEREDTEECRRGSGGGGGGGEGRIGFTAGGLKDPIEVAFHGNESRGSGDAAKTRIGLNGEVPAFGKTRAGNPSIRSLKDTEMEDRLSQGSRASNALSIQIPTL